MRYYNLTVIDSKIIHLKCYTFISIVLYLVKLLLMLLCFCLFVILVMFDLQISNLTFKKPENSRKSVHMGSKIQIEKNINPNVSQVPRVNFLVVMGSFILPR